MLEKIDKGDFKKEKDTTRVEFEGLGEGEDNLKEEEAGRSSRDLDNNPTRDAGEGEEEVRIFCYCCYDKVLLNENSDLKKEHLIWGTYLVEKN